MKNREGLLIVSLLSIFIFVQIALLIGIRKGPEISSFLSTNLSNAADTYISTDNLTTDTTTYDRTVTDTTTTDTTIYDRTTIDTTKTVTDTTTTDTTTDTATKDAIEYTTDTTTDITRTTDTISVDDTSVTNVIEKTDELIDNTETYVLPDIEKTTEVATTETTIATDPLTTDRTTEPITYDDSPETGTDAISTTEEKETLPETISAEITFPTTTTESLNRDAIINETKTTPVPITFPGTTTETQKPLLLEITFVDRIISPLTQSSRICVNSNRQVDNVLYRLEGPIAKAYTTTKVNELLYCSYIAVDNLPDGLYTLTAIAKKDLEIAKVIAKTEIKRLETTNTEPKTLSLTDRKCIELNIEDKIICQDTIMDSYSERIVCREFDTVNCKNYLKENYLEEIISIQEQYENIKNSEIEATRENLDVDGLENTIRQDDKNGSEQITMPIEEKNTNVRIIQTEEGIILTENTLVQTSPISIAVDSDNDGIPDDIEKRIGTDPFNADSDNDGHKDIEEILNGYDPLGAAKKEIELSPIDKAIINSQTLQHPKTSGMEDENFEVEKINNKTSKNGNIETGYIISGKASPNTVVTLYVYSEIPVVTTVSTDQYGNWQYEFSNTLKDGEHEIYVAVNDDTGKVLSKSNPLKFLVQEAKAISVEDVIGSDAVETRESDNMMRYYSLASVILIVLGILVFMALLVGRKNNKETTK